ncbi:MAG: hypothetical protein LBT50_04950 [Prevotellaceae bacterium]|nr:hypothetical protein [Prevotellaceae bacterium]
MKRFVFLIILIAGIATTAKSQNEVKPERVRKWFVEGGISEYAQSGGGYFGFMLSGGYYLTPDNRLSLDFAGHFKSEKISEFSYTVTTTVNGNVTDRETFYDGEVSRSYTIAPVLLSWGHEFAVSEKFRLRLGPSIGATTLSASDSYSPTSKNGVTIEGIPTDLRSESKSVFTAGAGIYGSWRIFKPSGISFGYRLLINKSATLEIISVKTAAHQFTLSYWWKL